MTKYYGLTNKPNKDVQDKAPEWMDSLFNKTLNKTASVKKASPFEGVNDPILNPQNHGVNKDSHKCEVCGADLKPGDVDICSECAK